MAKKLKLICLLSLCTLLLGSWANNGYAGMGISILPVSPVTGSAADENIQQKMQSVLENEFSRDTSQFTLRQSLDASLKEFQDKMSGLVRNEGKTSLKQADYFIVSTVGKYDKTIIYDIRIMDSETLSIIAAVGETVSANNWKNGVIQSIKSLQEKLIARTADTSISKIEKERITVFKIQEEGSQSLAKSVTAMLFSSLNSSGGFHVIERENARWAVEEKVAAMAGVVNRDPLKKAAEFYDIQLALEGTITTVSEKLFTIELKLINVQTGSLVFMMYDECNSLSEVRTMVDRITKNLTKRYLSKMSKLKITTTPAEASLYINSKYMGLTPCVITELEDGEYQFAIKKNGYQSMDFPIKVIAGEQQNYSYALKSIVWAYYTEAKNLENKKDWKNAINLYQKFAVENPGTDETIDAQFRVAHIYHYNLKDFEQATLQYQNLVQKCPDLSILSESLYGLGQCLINTSKKEEGNLILKKLIEEYPETSASDYAKKYLQELAVEKKK